MSTYRAGSARAIINPMNYLIVGLGNPGAEYENTRHNTGQILADLAAKKVENKKVKFAELSTFMNKSGLAVKKLITSKKAAEKLVVIYDDLDLPLGSLKISFNRGSGGHKGIESIIKALGTKEFIRIRVGICPITPSGKLKKISGEDVVIDFILGKFKPAELEIIKKHAKKITEIIETIATDGREVAMNQFN